MPSFSPTKAESKELDKLVSLAAESVKDLNLLLTNLSSDFSADDELARYVHSMKWRVKDSAHLQDKLLRKLRERREKGKTFSINERNLFARVNDLAGLRILHLYTRQFEHIHR